MSHSEIKIAGRRSNGRKGLVRQSGFTLIEIMIALGIIGSAVAVVYYYQTRSETSQQAIQASEGLVTMASKIRQYYGATNSFVALSGTKLNEIAVVPKGMKYDGTNVTDPWGNTMSINGSATSYALTVGGSTGPLDREACASIASKLAESAQSIRIGAATAAAGVIAGGALYKAAGAAPDPDALGTGCSTANPVVAAQFR